jgi:hypothetical protein
MRVGFARAAPSECPSTDTNSIDVTSRAPEHPPTEPDRLLPPGLVRPVTQICETEQEDARPPFLVTKRTGLLPDCSCAGALHGDRDDAGSAASLVAAAMVKSAGRRCLAPGRTEFAEGRPPSRKPRRDGWNHSSTTTSGRGRWATACSARRSYIDTGRARHGTERAQRQGSRGQPHPVGHQPCASMLGSYRSSWLCSRMKACNRSASARMLSHCAM